MTTPLGLHTCQCEVQQVGLGNSIGQNLHRWAGLEALSTEKERKGRHTLAIQTNRVTLTSCYRMSLGLMHKQGAHRTEGYSHSCSCSPLWLRLARLMLSPLAQASLSSFAASLAVAAAGEPSRSALQAAQV